MIEFTVLGHPEPAGSKRAFKHPHTGRVHVVDANQKSRPWKQEVAAEARRAYDGELLTGPLELYVSFYFARPKSHFGSGRNAGVLKSSAPGYPATRPDSTKLVRGVEDALTGVLWRDDAQVVIQHVYKFYGSPERVVVEVFPIYARSARQAA